MNPWILHHKAVMVPHTSIISESEVSITILCLLCSPRYTAVWIKNCLNSTLKNTVVLHAPVIVWNWSVHCPSLSSMFNSMHSSMNQELFEKHLCNQGSHYLLCKGSHHVQPANQCLLLSAKMNGAHRRTLVSLWRMHCTFYGVPKGTSQAKATSNSKNKLNNVLDDF